MFNKNFFIENIKTLFYALIIAIIIRSLFIQPFYIPSSSMEPNLLVGDRFLLQNIHMVIANIHFHLVLQFLKEEFFLMNQKEVMLLFLKHQQIIELIILKD